MRGLLASVLAALIFPVCAFAQLTTATGRTITMSDAGWKIFIPSTYQQRGNVADLLVHFHGDPQTYWNIGQYLQTMPLAKVQVPEPAAVGLIATAVRLLLRRHKKQMSS